MGWNFRYNTRRRKNQSMWLNFSKRGMSFSWQPIRGITYNFGRNGRRRTVNLGNGIYHTKYTKKDKKDSGLLAGLIIILILYLTLAYIYYIIVL
jgi:hypothetical protein